MLKCSDISFPFLIEFCIRLDGFLVYALVHLKDYSVVIRTKSTKPVFFVYAAIHLKDSSVMPRATALISFVWHRSFGLQLSLLLFIVQLSDTKLMLRILSPCFTCMFGVCTDFCMLVK